MLTKEKRKMNPYVKAIICLVVFLGFFSIFSIPMGLGNALNTLMNTAYQILIDTVFYIMAIAVIAGAVSSLLTEFGVVALLNKLLSPLMRPLFGMPGASSLGIVSTYLSDNPAILTLADDNKFRRYFKAYQIPALTNLGTSFGMGLIVTSYALGPCSFMGKQVGMAALCGNLGAIIGAIISTRIMLLFMKKAYGKEKPALEEEIQEDADQKKFTHKGFLHVLDALMDGGKKGVEMGLAVIPGVLIICSVVLMLTNGKPAGTYSSITIERVAVVNGVENTLDMTDNIRLPERGNYIRGFSKNSSVVHWALYSSDGLITTVHPTYSSTRTFSDSDKLYVQVSDDVPPAPMIYRMILHHPDGTSESLDMELERSNGKGANRLYSVTMPTVGYSGKAKEGIALLPKLAEKIDFLLKPLFGFSSGEALAVPVTALGSAGAALGLIPELAKRGVVNSADLAVFIAICMCWSGYLSTHVSMMEVLGCREHTGKAIISHTIGGLCAGVAAHWLYVLFLLI